MAARRPSQGSNERELRELAGRTRFAVAEYLNYMTERHDILHIPQLWAKQKMIEERWDDFKERLRMTGNEKFIGSHISQTADRIHQRIASFKWKQKSLAREQNPQAFDTVVDDLSSLLAKLESEFTHSCRNRWAQLLYGDMRWWNKCVDNPTIIPVPAAAESQVEPPMPQSSDVELRSYPVDAFIADGRLRKAQSNAHRQPADSASARDFPEGLPNRLPALMAIPVSTPPGIPPLGFPGSTVQGAAFPPVNVKADAHKAPFPASKNAGVTGYNSRTYYNKKMSPDQLSPHDYQFPTEQTDDDSSRDSPDPYLDPNPIQDTPSRSYDSRTFVNTERRGSRGASASSSRTSHRGSRDASVSNSRTSQGPRRVSFQGSRTNQAGSSRGPSRSGSRTSQTGSSRGPSRSGSRTSQTVPDIGSTTAFPGVTTTRQGPDTLTPDVTLSGRPAHKSYSGTQQQQREQPYADDDQ